MRHTGIGALLFGNGTALAADAGVHRRAGDIESAFMAAPAQRLSGFQHGIVRAAMCGCVGTFGVALLRGRLHQSFRLAVSIAPGHCRRDFAATLHLGNGNYHHRLLHATDEVLPASAQRTRNGRRARHVRHERA